MYISRELLRRSRWTLDEWPDRLWWRNTASIGFWLMQLGDGTNRRGTGTSMRVRAAPRYYYYCFRSIIIQAITKKQLNIRAMYWLCNTGGEIWECGLLKLTEGKDNGLLGHHHGCVVSSGLCTSHAITSCHPRRRYVSNPQLQRIFSHFSDGHF